MKSKIITLLFILSLLSGSVYAQQNYRVIPSPWAFSWGAGLGAMTPTGGLADNFKSGFAADTELNVYYNNMFFMLNGGIASTAPARDIPVVMVNDRDTDEAVWPSESNAIQAFIGANIGVNLFASEDINFYPFAGIGYGFIEPNLKTANSDPVLSALKINSFIWNAGIGVDYNIPDKNYEEGRINKIQKVGLRYQFQKPNYDKDIQGFDGATHWITLRFVIGSTMPGRVIYY